MSIMGILKIMEVQEDDIEVLEEAVRNEAKSDPIWAFESARLHHEVNLKTNSSSTFVISSYTFIKF